MTQPLLTESEIHHAAQFRPGSVAVGAVVIRARDTETEGATMTWTPEALSAVRDLQTTCPDFINAACEWTAEKKGATVVTAEHVATVLAWLISTKEVEL